MKFRLLFLLLVLVLSGSAQNSLDSLGRFSYNVGVNDIWAYEDELGNEYALVGLENGVSVVDISNPSSLNEVYRVSGPTSSWRDLKVYDDYLYVTNEEDSGLMIIDLSPLPQSNVLDHKYYKGDSWNEFTTAHNLFIDENGVGYIVGANRNNGGVIMLNLSSDPWNPSEIKEIDDAYVHDAFVRNDTLVTSNVGDGTFSIYDVSNKNTPVLLASQFTKDKTTHNAWLSEDGNYVFTTDEVNGGSIGSFDMSDLNDVEELDAFKKYPYGVEMPHNVLVKEKYLFISYYKEGLVIVDAQNPKNLVELVSFDTDKNRSGANSGGAWGVYPYLKNNRVIVSDMSNGLFVFGYQLTGASFLEGRVTDLSTGFPLVNVDVELKVSGIFDVTNLNGDYKTGTSVEGMTQLIYSKAGYVPDTIIIDLKKDQIIIQNVQLEPLERFDLEVNVFGNGDLSATKLHLITEGFEEEYLSDNNGGFLIPNIFAGNFEMYLGKWGYKSFCFQDSIHSQNKVFNFNLDEGYEDDFSSDQGWEGIRDGHTSIWQRTVPVGSFSTTNIQYDPNEDGSDLDCGSYAFCTGINQNVLPGSSTANGLDHLFSPSYQLTDKNEPVISLNYWMSFQWNSEDTLSFGLISEQDTVDVLTLTEQSDQREWKELSFNVNDFLTNYSSFQLVVTIEDSGDWNVIDAAVDNVSVEYLVSTPELKKECKIERIGTGYHSACSEELFLYDIQGRLLKKENIVLRMNNYKDGIYLIGTVNSKLKKVIWKN